MLDGLRIAVVMPAYNEAARMDTLLPALPTGIVDAVVVVDDASTDGTGNAARRHGAFVITKTVRAGPGPAIRDALDWLCGGGGPSVDAVVVMAANGKHDPAQIPDLIRPLAAEGLDLVRGSRFLSGGSHVRMPWHRLALIRVFTALTALVLRQPVTDATGGFQAYRLAILDDPAIRLHQRWLGRYEVETYLFVKTLLHGYRWREVPVRITYPEQGRYTRARTVIDWWAYFRPVLLLRMGVRR